MKKILAGLLIILVVAGVAGGIYYKNSPYKVIYDFKKAVDAGNYEEALEYVDPELRSYIETAFTLGGTALGLISKFNPDIPADVLSKLSEKAASIEWKVTDIGKESSREHYVSLMGDYSKDETINLDLIIKKISGKWYIAGIENVKLVNISE